MRIDKAWHEHAPVTYNDVDMIFRINGDRIQSDSLRLVSRTCTLEGAESLAVLPSKMRTF